jgi:hypothetical protein
MRRIHPALMPLYAAPAANGDSLLRLVAQVLIRRGTHVRGFSRPLEPVMHFSN